jgi:hypothetical protein
LAENENKYATPAPAATNIGHFGVIKLAVTSGARAASSFSRTKYYVAACTPSGLILYSLWLQRRNNMDS